MPEATFVEARRAVHAAVLLAPLALTSCASSAVPPSAGPQPSRVPAPKVDRLAVATSDGSWRLVVLDSPRVDSLREAGVILQQNVDERPDVLHGPQLHYPDQARQACIQGRVVAQAIVGRDGRAEPPSIGLRVRSLHAGFDQEALRYMREAIFKPGTVHGVAVRTLVDLPIDFSIRGAC